MGAECRCTVTVTAVLFGGSLSTGPRVNQLITGMEKAEIESES